MLRDPEFGPTRIRAYGTYSVRVKDPALFMTEIVGTDGEFTMDEISFPDPQYHRAGVFSRVIAGSGIPGLDMAANTADLGKMIAAEISQIVAGYGLSIPEFYIENISLPPAVEEALDKRTSMGLAGDLGKFTQYSAAEAMTKAASNPNGGGGMGAGLGMGMGMAMANQMANQGPWGAQKRAHLPPRNPRRRPRRRSNMSGTLPKTAKPRGRSPRQNWAAWHRPGKSPAKPMSGPPVRTAGCGPKTCRNWRSSSPSCRRRRRGCNRSSEMR